MSRWFQNARVRRGLALGAVVLSTGGLVLYKAPAQAHTPFAQVIASGKNVREFSGPGVKGAISLSHAKVLSGTPTTVFAEVRLAATADATDRLRERAPISMAVVIDTSGSMSGEKIAEARRSVLKLVQDMRDDDEIALVRYSDTSELVQSLARVGLVRTQLERKIRDLQPGGGTNIAPAMSHGRRALDEASSGRVKRIVLVSDGLDATRQQSESVARSSFESGITVSSLGIGLDFDEGYMGSVAMNGHGNFAFVKDGASLAHFLNKELIETSSTTVEQARVKVRIPQGFTFARSSGADARVTGDEVELVFGSLFVGDERRAIVELRATLPEGRAADLGATVSWTQVGGNRASVDVPTLTVLAVRNQAEVERARDGAVLASAVSVLASQRQLEAAEAYTHGDLDRATSLIDQNVRALEEAKAAAPMAAATALSNQADSYRSAKTGFSQAGPGSDEGRMRAKASAAQEINNLSRKAF